MREIGLLRGLGATRGFIFELVLGEALLVVLIGSVLGLGTSAGLILLFSRLIALRLEVPFYWPPAGELARLGLSSLALAGLTGALAALFPALRASRMEPYEAIRRGE